MSSADFVALVDQKLAEVGAPSLAGHAARFGLTEAERRELSGPGMGDLVAVLRYGAEPFDLDGVLRYYDSLWSKTL
jgi:hypothetical protein